MHAIGVKNEHLEKQNELATVIKKKSPRIDTRFVEAELLLLLLFLHHYQQSTAHW